MDKVIGSTHLTQKAFKWIRQVMKKNVLLKELQSSDGFGQLDFLLKTAVMQIADGEVATILQRAQEKQLKFGLQLKGRQALLLLLRELRSEAERSNTLPHKTMITMRPVKGDLVEFLPRWDTVVDQLRVKDKEEWLLTTFPDRMRECPVMKDIMHKWDQLPPHGGKKTYDWLRKKASVVVSQLKEEKYRKELTQSAMAGNIAGDGKLNDKPPQQPGVPAYVAGDPSNGGDPAAAGAGKGAGNGGSKKGKGKGKKGDKGGNPAATQGNDDPKAGMPQCRWWKYGCRFGDRCTHRHDGPGKIAEKIYGPPGGKPAASAGNAGGGAGGQPAAAAKPIDPAKGICYFVADGLACKRGDGCPRSHDEALCKAYRQSPAFAAEKAQYAAAAKAAAAGRDAGNGGTKKNERKGAKPAAAGAAVTATVGPTQLDQAAK